MPRACLCTSRQFKCRTAPFTMMKRVALRRLSAAATPTPTPSLVRRPRPAVDRAKLSLILDQAKELSANDKVLLRNTLLQNFGFHVEKVDTFLGDLREKALAVDMTQIAAPPPVAATEGVKEAAAAAPVKSEFNLKLESFAAGDKIKVIKLVREMLGLGLKETKEKVEGVPVVLLNDLPKSDADEWVAKLEAIGAKCILE